MVPYANISGDSGVVSYEFDEKGIWVKFSKGMTYLYGYNRPGAHHLEVMKELAANGQGLCGYINRYVKRFERNYEDKR